MPPGTLSNADQMFLLASGDSAGSQPDEKPTERYVYSSRGPVTVVSASIASNFARLLPRTPMIEAVAWDWEGDVLRIWTVIAQRNQELQREIYAVEGGFLDLLEKRLCDFTVIFREGRELAHVLPSAAQVLQFRD